MKAALRTAPLKEVKTPIIEKDATPMGEVATQIELMKAALKIAPLKKELKIPKKPIADIKDIIPKEMFSSNLMEDTFETIGNMNGNSAPAKVNPAPIRDDFTLNTDRLQFHPRVLENLIDADSLALWLQQLFDQVLQKKADIIQLRN